MLVLDGLAGRDQRSLRRQTPGVPLERLRQNLWRQVSSGLGESVHHERRWRAWHQEAGHPERTVYTIRMTPQSSWAAWARQQVQIVGLQGSIASDHWRPREVCCRHTAVSISYVKVGDGSETSFSSLLQPRLTLRATSELLQLQQLLQDVTLIEAQDERVCAFEKKKTTS